jgi:hypothetical protein
VYFCTRIDADVHRKPDKLKKTPKKIYFQKRLKKVCEIRKRMLHLHPAKSATILEKLVLNLRRNRKKIFFKKLHKKFARLKRIVTFAPANREVIEKKIRTRS